MKKCDDCKYWSELLAYSDGGSPIKAMYLNEKSPRYQKYSAMGCDCKIEGMPIDAPGCVSIGMLTAFKPTDRQYGGVAPLEKKAAIVESGIDYGERALFKLRLTILGQPVEGPAPPNLNQYSVAG